MTQRKVVLTSASAVAARPRYVPSKAVVGNKEPFEKAPPSRSAERSEAESTTIELTNPSSHVRMYARARDVSHPEPRPPARDAAPRTRNARTHEADRTHLNLASRTDGLLSEMTKQQRRDLLDRLALENTKPAGGRDLDMWSASVARALEDAIGGSGRAAYGQMLCKRQLGLSSTWAPIEAFMRSSGLSELVVVERQAVYNLLAELIVEAAGFNARRSGAPLSLKLAASHTGQINGIFERAFPGYLAAGLAPVVARQSLRM